MVAMVTSKSGICKQAQRSHIVYSFTYISELVEVVIRVNGNSNFYDLLLLQR